MKEVEQFELYSYITQRKKTLNRFLLSLIDG